MIKKKTTILLAAMLTTSLHGGEPVAAPQPTPSTDYGTFSGRIQYLGMYRDYDNGNNGHSSTLGLMLGYQSPKFGGFDMGFAYNYAATLFDGGNTALLANDDIHVGDQISHSTGIVNGSFKIRNFGIIIIIDPNEQRTI